MRQASVETLGSGISAVMAAARVDVLMGRFELESLEGDGIDAAGEWDTPLMSGGEYTSFRISHVFREGMGYICCDIQKECNDLSVLSEQWLFSKFERPVLVTLILSINPPI